MNIELDNEDTIVAQVLVNCYGLKLRKLMDTIVPLVHDCEGVVGLHALKEGWAIDFSVYPEDWILEKLADMEGADLPYVMISPEYYVRGYSKILRRAMINYEGIEYPKRNDLWHVMFEPSIMVLAVLPKYVVYTRTIATLAHGYGVDMKKICIATRKNWATLLTHPVEKGSNIKRFDMFSRK